jgi:hypothetical protein
MTDSVIGACDSPNTRHSLSGPQHGPGFVFVHVLEVISVLLAPVASHNSPITIVHEPINGSKLSGPLQLAILCSAQRLQWITPNHARFVC